MCLYMCGICRFCECHVSNSFCSVFLSNIKRILRAKVTELGKEAEVSGEQIRNIWENVGKS